MKALIIPLIFLIATSVASDTDTIKINTQLNEVTVYFSGAEITRRTHLSLNPGIKILVFEQLPAELYPQTISIEPIPHTKITAVKHEQYKSVSNTNVNEQNLSSEFRDQLESLLKEREEIRLAENKNVDRTLHTLLDALNENTNPNKSALQQLNEGLVSRNNQNAGKVYSRVIVSLSCARANKAQVALNYFVPSAQWTPVYDFHVSDTQSPVKMITQALISQSTGEVWKKSKITVSSKNPRKRNGKPGLKKWVIDRKQSTPVNSNIIGPGKIEGRLLCRKNNTPISLANVFIKKEGYLTGSSISDSDGYFEISPVSSGEYQLEVSVEGYESEEVEELFVQSGRTTFSDIRLRSERNKIQATDIVSFSVPVIAGVISPADRANTLTQLSGQLVSGTIAVVNNLISGRDNSSDAKYYVDDTPSTMPVSSHTSKVQHQNIPVVELTISGTQTILPDDREHLLSIKESLVDARYVYYAVPKVQADVYLLAEIDNLSRLNLIPGQSRVYHNGAFTGQQSFTHENCNDTLTLILGLEPKISVIHQSNTNLSNRRTAGNIVKEMVAWDIEIENGLDHPISMIVEDQLPISSGESITVKPFKSSATEIDHSSGIVKWELGLAAQETQTIRHGFTIQYPIGTRLYTD